MSCIDLEICQAKRDVQLIVNQYGKVVTLFLRDEPKVTRDKYNSIKSEGWTSQYTFKVFPFQTSPSTKQLEKAGILEAVDAVAWFSMKDFEDKGIGSTDIIIEDNVDSIRSAIVADGGEYRIKQKSLNSPFGDSYLYLVLGLNKI